MWGSLGGQGMGTPIFAALTSWSFFSFFVFGSDDDGTCGSQLTLAGISENDGKTEKHLGTVYHSAWRGGGASWTRSSAPLFMEGFSPSNRQREGRWDYVLRDRKQYVWASGLRLATEDGHGYRSKPLFSKDPWLAVQSRAP